MSSFGGTVKLTGESEYKKALADISSNLRVLNSEMKVVTSQYDKNDKSALNLTQQNDVLSKKLAEQRDKVDILRKALNEAEQETGENSATTKKWQTELNNAQAELNKLVKEIQDNEKAMEQSADATKEEADAVEDFGEEADKSGEKALSLGDIIKANLISDAIKGGLQALANGISAIGSAMTESLSAGAEYADNILTLSAQTGLSTDTLEKYNAVAELADVSMETFTGSLAKNVKAMGEAQKGSAKYVEAYDKLGVKVTDANGNLRDSEAVYWETVDALKGIENETERDAMAMELFGKKAQDLNTIIDMGSEGFGELEQSAVDMGAVLGGEGLEALGNLDDEMQKFKSTTASTGNILASAFAPAVSQIMGEVNDIAGEFNGLIASVISGDQDAIDGAVTRVLEEVWDIVYGIEDILPQLIQTIEQLLGTILNLLMEMMPDILQQGAKLLTSLIQGIANNLPSLVSTVMEIVNTLLNVILENLPTIIEMGMQMLVSLVQGIAEMLPELIPTMIDTVVLMVETLLDNLDLLIDVAIDLIMALADGLLEALPRLIDKIPVIIDKLITAITNNLPKIIEMGIELTIKLAVGIVKAIPQLVAKIPQIISSLVSGLLSGLGKIAEVGKNLVQGLWEGIKGLASWLWDKVSGWISGIWDGILDFFGIASPSKKMKWVGEMMVDGMAVSIDENGDEAVESAKQMSENVMSAFDNINADGITSTMAEITNAIPSQFDTDISANLNASAVQSQMSTYDMMVSAFKVALTEVKVVMDDREMGGFITNTVERVVFA